MARKAGCETSPGSIRTAAGKTRQEETKTHMEGTRTSQEKPPVGNLLSSSFLVWIIKNLSSLRTELWKLSRFKFITSQLCIIGKTAFILLPAEWNTRWRGLSLKFFKIIHVSVIHSKWPPMSSCWFLKMFSCVHYRMGKKMLWYEFSVSPKKLCLSSKHDIHGYDLTIIRI